MPIARGILALLVVALGATATRPPAVAATPDPAWLRLAPGTVALVDLAPWSSARPEAALTADEVGAAALAEESTTRPDDAIPRPVGTAVVITEVLGDGVVQIRGATPAGPSYGFTIVDRLEPRVPPGTPLVVAGGFAGFAYLYPALDSAESAAAHLETGARITAGETAVGGVRADSNDFVRLHVRVRSGSLAGRSGWIAVAYGGLPRPARDGRTPTERACSCRVLEFR